MTNKKPPPRPLTYNLDGPQARFSSYGMHAGFVASLPSGSAIAQAIPLKPGKAPKKPGHARGMKVLKNPRPKISYT